jgi:hypothetical protein
MMNQPGQEPVPLTIPQIAELLRNQQDVIAQQEGRIRELEFMNKQLQAIIVENAKQMVPAVQSTATPSVQPAAKPATIPPTPPLAQPSKSEPLFKIDDMAIF